MRNDRGMTLAAMVVVLCCMGIAQGATPSGQSNVFISRVIVDAYPTMSKEPSSNALEQPEQTSSCCLLVEIVQQIEIEELHNLPPPALINR